MPRPLLEQEVGERIGLRRPAEVQRVAVVRAQIALHGPGFIIGILVARGDLLGQFRDAGIEHGQLQIRFANRVRII